MRFARRLKIWAWLPAVGFALTASGLVSSPAGPNAVAAMGPKARYGLLPLSFEPNDGQTDPRVRFLTHGQGYSLFLTQDEAVLALKARTVNGSGASASSPAVLRMRLRGVRAGGRVEGVDELPGKSNYFIGNDPSKWRTDIPNYGRVEYREVYPGVDLVYYGHQGQLEYDFVLKAGADPRELWFGMEGAGRARINEAGDLVLETGGGEVVLRRPVAYQGTGAKRRSVKVSYICRGGDVGFEVGKYRRNQVLTIDPVLVYSTFLGGVGGDIAYGIAVDSAGNAYVTGVTGSVNFPTKSAAQPKLDGVTNAFVTKLNSTGSGLIYSTFVGGTGSDLAAAIAVDAGGNAYITGNTSSSDFPVTAGVFQSAYGGGTDAFIAKIAASGASLVYASYLGGSAADFAQGIAIGSSGDAYLTGSTQSFDFPTVNPLQIGNDGCTTVNLVQTCSADVFVAEVNATASALVYATYLGGSGSDSGQAIAVDAGGNAYIAGSTSSADFPNQNALQSRSGGGTDAFVTELNPSGAGLVFSTYLGGSANDQAYGLVLDSSGNIYVAGSTQSNNFPTTPNVFQTTYAGAGDGFLTKLGAAGTVLVYSTFVGGSGADQASAVAVDSTGGAVVVGSTQSSNFPLVDPSQRVLGISGAASCGTATGSSGVCSDAFITRLNPSGMPVYSTFLGGTQADFAQAVAVDSAGSPYVAGSTASSNFPAVVGAVQGAYAGIENSGNAFVSKIEGDDLPGVALSPQALNFGNQTLNVASPAQSITLTNPGSAPLSITGITGSSDYAVSSNCGNSVPAGSGSCTINVTFTPVTAGPSTDELTITDGAAGSPHHVAVTGTGVTGGAGTLTLTPNTLVFPVQALNTTSPPQVVEVVNSGTSAITISAISATGDFNETNTCGVQPSILNAGASCVLSITFTPTKSGSAAGTLMITDNAAGSPQSVLLSGAGGGVFTLSASNLSSNILVGTASTTFTISASAASSFTSSIGLACSGATCSFNPASIMPGQSSVLTVSGLSALTANPLNFAVTGTSTANTANLSLKIFLQDFSITATPPLASLNAGQSTTYTVTATPTNGFNQVVLLSCASVLPINATCAWTPTSGLVLNGLSPSSAVLTVTTTTQQSSRGWRTRYPFGGPGGQPASRTFWMTLTVILAICGALAARHKRVRLIPSVVLAALALVLTTAAMSCNNYGYNVIAPPTITGTPNGTYTISIFGTLGSNKTVVRSTSVNLTVGPG